MLAACSSEPTAPAPTLFNDPNAPYILGVFTTPCSGTPGYLDVTINEQSIGRLTASKKAETLAVRVYPGTYRLSIQTNTGDTTSGSIVINDKSLYTGFLQPRCD